MDLQNFSDRFDLLFNNITSNQAPGLNEWEKSVFLTKAQDEIVKNYASPKGNSRQEGFDGSPKRQVDFSTIIRNVSLQAASFDSTFDSRARCYVLPEDMFISLNEQLVAGNNAYTILPISYDEYDRLMSKPYKYPPKYQAWRLITNRQAGMSYTYHSKSSFASNLSADDYGKYLLNVQNLATDRALQFKVEVSSNGETGPIAQSADANTNRITCKLNGLSSNNETITDYFEKYFSAPDPSIARITGKVAIVDTTIDEGLPSSFFLLADDEQPLGGILEEGDPSIELWDITIPKATGSSVSKTIIEIIGVFPESPVYKIRYVKRPRPIVLVDLEDGMNVNGESQASSCELPEELHEEILQRAVELAKVAWQGDLNTALQTGQRSE